MKMRTTDIQIFQWIKVIIYSFYSMTHATLYTDCSYHPTTRTGAYACYIRCEEHVEKMTGDLPEKVLMTKSPIHVGELYGICQGIKQAVSRFGVHFIYVRTDSKKALEWIENGDHAIDEVKTLITWLREFLHKYDVYVDWKKVQAHQTDGSSQTWVNNWCDQAAKHRARQLYHIRKKEIVGKKYVSKRYGKVILESIKGNHMICFKLGNNQKKIKIQAHQFYADYKRYT